MVEIHHGSNGHGDHGEFEEPPFRLRDIYTNPEDKATLIISLGLLSGPIIGCTAWYIALTGDYQTPLVVETAAIFISTGAYLVGKVLHRRKPIKPTSS